MHKALQDIIKGYNGLKDVTNGYSGFRTLVTNHKVVQIF